jgi:predicted sulfurtransferase
MEYPKLCARCAADLSKTAHTMSKFNTDEICMECKRRERQHPRYKAADRAEMEACKRGDLNFPGIGCPPELYISNKS